jgi:putative thioredoxin
VIFDATDSSFRQAVLERSAEVPVVVDFWAEWCGPCRQLTPALESSAASREGRVDLAKVDVDSNPLLSQTYRIQGIPAVKAFRDGAIVHAFTGALPPARIEEFLDALLPSAADELAAAGDEESLRSALEEDPRHAESARALGRILLMRGDDEEARELLERFSGDFLADGLLARLRLAGQAADGTDPSLLERAFAAWDDGDHAAALDALQEALGSTGDPQARDLLRQVMVAIFTELGSASSPRSPPGSSPSSPPACCRSYPATYRR